jgi:hypothetical protein
LAWAVLLSIVAAGWLACMGEWGGPGVMGEVLWALTGAYVCGMSWVIARRIKRRGGKAGAGRSAVVEEDARCSGGCEG